MPTPDQRTAAAAMMLPFFFIGACGGRVQTDDESVTTMLDSDRRLELLEIDSFQVNIGKILQIRHVAFTPVPSPRAR